MCDKTNNLFLNDQNESEELQNKKKTCKDSMYNEIRVKQTWETYTSTPCIIVHGGAGEQDTLTIIEKMNGCKNAASNGYRKMMQGGNAIEGVEAALWWLECDEFFNAGYGSVLNEIGGVQMDASIMDGSRLMCGGVVAVSDIEHPISLAKYVLEKFPNTIIAGEGAKRLAKYAKMNVLSEYDMVAPASYLACFSPTTGMYGDSFNPGDRMLPNLLEQLQSPGMGTVGCVAWDGKNIAAGTTTGGLSRKMVGRVGDSAILGCGTYANTNVGCSVTGHGESIIKCSSAREIVESVRQNCNPRAALTKHFDAIHDKFSQTGGGIVLHKNGCWATYFTSKRMPYAAIHNGIITYGAHLDEKRTDTYREPNMISTCGCPFFCKLSL